jgi:uncharacterized membrane protein YfcA
VSFSRSVLCAVIAFVITYATMWMLNGNPQLLNVGLIAVAVALGVNLGVRYRTKLES